MNYRATSLTELIWRAKLGDSGAMGEIMRRYSPLIRKKSRYRGMYDEDCRQHISLYLLEQMQNFTFQEIPFFHPPCLIHCRGQKTSANLDN